MAPVSATPAVEHRHTAAVVPFAGFAAVLGSAALFGTLGPLSRFAYEAGAEPAAWVAWRGVTGLLALSLLITWRRAARSRGSARSCGSARTEPAGGRRAIPGRAWAALLVAAMMGMTLNLSLFFAFDRITIALALLGFYTYPAMVAAVNVARGREALDTARLVALALALFGMTLVVASQLDPAAGVRLDALGIGLALGAALSQTVYVVVSRDGYPQVPTEQAIAAVMLVATFGAMVVAFVGAGPAALVPPLTVPGFLPLLLFTGIFAAAIPSVGFLYGIRAIGGLRAGILMLFEPVVGVALAAWLLDEGLAPIQVVGALAILAAAVILQRAGRPADEPAAHAAVTVGGGP